MKLDKFEKQERKDLIINYFDNSLILMSFDRVTVAFVKTGPNRGKIAWSIHSSNDGKFHRKYGEYVALGRLWDCGMPIEFSDISDVPQILKGIGSWASINN